MTTNQSPESKTKTIATEDLLKRLDDLVVVDVRSTAAYNGWRLRGEARGGHIAGAALLPDSWLDGLTDEELLLLLDNKGIGQSRSIVVYGDTPEHADRLQRKLSDFGYSDVATYRGGFGEWATDPTLPVEGLVRYEQLVHPEWVRQLLAGENPDTYQGNGFLVFHVNFGVPEEYEEGHIPGALYLDTNWLESPQDWNRRSPNELQATLTALGISAHTTLVLYGRDTLGNPNEKWPGRRAGQISATRAAAILMYAGVKDVRLLDGGYDRWVTSGYPLDTALVSPIPIESLGVSIPQHPDYIVDIAEAKQILADREGAALVSVRTWKEHIGKVSGYNYIEPAGRIAGDFWGNCGTDAYHMQHYRSIDNTMRAYPEIASNWEGAGITPEKWVAFYCGTGWRASETWFYAFLMGWERIAVYDGGWFEWSQDPENNPIEVGEPANEAAA
ncbi:MAG TPA: rhodanese-like domain-containing protein [Acidimicrobiia bacterium]|nr:rhodanese-like domain-containing protein [Acidimicrobiia bacterium]